MAEPPLGAGLPLVFMDAIHYKGKENHRYETKAAYVILGITLDGKKDILGVWIGEHESSKLCLLIERRIDPLIIRVPG